MEDNGEVDADEFGEGSMCGVLVGEDDVEPSEHFVELAEGVREARDEAVVMVARNGMRTKLPSCARLVVFPGEVRLGERERQYSAPRSSAGNGLGPQNKCRFRGPCER